MAASPNECVPTFTATGASAKCCAGNVKNMKLVITVTDPTNCLLPADGVCILDLTVDTPNDTIGSKVGLNQCVAENGEITIYLLDVSNCSVNLTVTYSINGVTGTAALKSENIPSGNQPDSVCVPPAA